MEPNELQEPSGTSQRTRTCTRCCFDPFFDAPWLTDSGRFDYVRPEDRNKFTSDHKRCDMCLAYAREYNQRPDVQRKNRQFRERNRDALRQKAKQYFQRNKSKSRARVTCACGSTVSQAGLKSHKATAKHRRFEETGCAQPLTIETDNGKKCLKIRYALNGKRKIVYKRYVRAGFAIAMKEFQKQRADILRALSGLTAGEQ